MMDDGSTAPALSTFTSFAIIAIVNSICIANLNLRVRNSGMPTRDETYNT